MKEVEWTVLFYFPREELEPMRPYFPTNKGTFEEFNSNNLKNARVWTNKNEAKEYGKTIAGKYHWTLMPTVIEGVIY